MDGRRSVLFRSMLVICLLANGAPSVQAGGIESLKHFFGGEDDPLTLKDVAYLVDCLDDKLANMGTIGVKTPDVWGQNRMTRFRAEYELQMAQNLDQFQLILQGAQRRSDTAVLTSATSLAATVAASSAATSRGGRGASPAVVVPSGTGTAGAGSSGSQPENSITINTAGTGTASSSGGSGSSGSGASSGSTAPSATDPTALLSDISAKLAALQNGLLQLPPNINSFATQTGQNGVGLEPTIQLDEQQTYINHLHQLRRVNAGDDTSDMAGYGLYLMRMPISLMPGPESRKGKGAIVTMEARHELSSELLETTLRDVVVLDVTYSLTEVINEELHRQICGKCAPPKKKSKRPSPKKFSQYELRLITSDERLNEIPVKGKELIVVARTGGQRLHFRVFDGVGKVIVETDSDRLTAEANDRGHVQRLLDGLRTLLVYAWPPRMVTPRDKAAIVETIKDLGIYKAVDDVDQGLPDIEGVLQDDCDDDDVETLMDDAQRALMGGLKTGPGPNSVRLGNLRIILGPTCWPAPPGSEEGEDDEAPESGGGDVKNQTTKETKPASPALTPIPAGTPATGSATTGASRGGDRPKSDDVIRTQGPGLPGPGLTRRWDISLPVSLRGPSNRLRLVYNAINEAQQAPYRHDPSTLSLLRAALIDAHFFVRSNVQNTPLFQGPRIENLGRLYLQRNYKLLLQEREKFLMELVAWRNGYPMGTHPATWDRDSSLWERQLTPTDVLAFLLILQSYAVDRYIKDDMKIVAGQRGLPCDDVEALTFYDFLSQPAAQAAFNEYVERKWPIKVYSVNPVLNQQNILDAFSRRTELQLALAASVASGQVNIKNATSYARQLDLDLETVGLNRTSVGFGAGESTFGWLFYPRVQTPPTQSNPRRIASLLYWNGPPPNYDVMNRQIEPGQQECIAIIVAPNFIPAIGLSTVANWFDITGGCASRELSNREMLDYSHMLQKAQNALTRVCDSREYRKSDLTTLTRRVRQLSQLLPTQDYRIDLPDEGDLLGSEIFSSNAAGLAPSLLAWYGEHPQEGQNSSIFLMGRGFSVAETQVVAGGVDVPEAQRRLISRNVMEIVIPANARVNKHKCPGAEDDDHQAGHAATSGTPKKAKACGSAVIDVHVATPNGISNHLYVETEVKPTPPAVKNVVLTATTSTAADPVQHRTTTSTRVETTPPGLALPPLTVLPLGTQWPAHSVMAQGSVNGAPSGSIFPGMVNPTPAAAPIPPPILDQTAPPSVSVPSTPGPSSPTAPSIPPEGIPLPPVSQPGQPVQPTPAGEPAPITALPPTPEPTRLVQAVGRSAPRSAAYDEAVVPARHTADPSPPSRIAPPRSSDVTNQSRPESDRSRAPRGAVPLMPPLSLRTAPPPSARRPDPAAQPTARPIPPPRAATKAQTTRTPARRSLRQRLGLGDR